MKDELDEWIREKIGEWIFEIFEPEHPWTELYYEKELYNAVIQLLNEFVDKFLQRMIKENFKELKYF